MPFYLVGIEDLFTGKNLIKPKYLIQDNKTGKIFLHFIKVNSKELTLIKRNNHPLGVGAKVRIYLQKGIAKTYVEVDIYIAGFQRDR